MPSLSSTQIAEAKEAFALYAKSAEGKLPIDDLGQLLRSCGRNPTNAEVEALYHEADPTESGQVDQKGFLKALEKCVCKADQLEEVKEAFRVFDLNQNGFVPLSELRHVLTTLGEKLTNEEVDSLLRDAEIDQDGNINYADFAASLMPKQL